MLSLQTREGDVLRVEGVAVPGLVQSEDPLLPPGAVQLAGQVVPGIITTGTNHFNKLFESEEQKRVVFF